MRESTELALKEQRITVRRALDAWVKIGGTHEYYILRDASLNGDTLWIHDKAHFWLGADLLWEDSTIGTKWVQKVFFHVFPDLAEFDARLGSEVLPPEMDGLRQSSTLEDAVAYYLEG